MLMPRPGKGHTIIYARGEFIWAGSSGCGLDFKWGRNLQSVCKVRLKVGQGNGGRERGMWGNGWKLSL
jgi:hypothetical protein